MLYLYSMPRKAHYLHSIHKLIYWKTDSVMIGIACDSKDQAMEIVTASGINQELIIYK